MVAAPGSSTSWPPTPVSPRQERDEAIRSLTEEHLDLLVVGGGITGAGIMRDAALRGLRVGLVDKGDYGQGTSSRSSKLVHGGLRYLENLEFSLVFEGTRERYIQRRLNPNLVSPLSFVFPVYEHSPNGLWKVNLGLWLYDLLSIFRAYRRHRRLGSAATAGMVPGLRDEGLRGSVTYFDCRTDDARLTLSNVLAGVAAGGIAVNHMAYVEARTSEGRVSGATVKDHITGTVSQVSADHIVYAAGPWIDTLPDAPGDGRLLRPTKGVHVVVSSERLPLEHALVMSGIHDGRVVFALPWQGATYIGTTDTDFDGDADAVRASSEDVAYLLETTNHFFPDAGLRPRDVRSTWAGLRPLVRSQSATAYKTSREHRMFFDTRGITTIAGGKLTTYRSMAKEVVDHVAKVRRTLTGERTARCQTHRTPLDPGLPRPPKVHEGFDDPFDDMLWRHHGSHMDWVKDRMRAHPVEGEPVSAGLPYVMAQVSLAVLHEHSLLLEDVLVRRLQVFFRAPDQGLAAARRVASHMAALLGHDAAWASEQCDNYASIVQDSRLGQQALNADA